MENTDLFLTRYKHHIITPGFGVPGQEALAKSRILVIGAGELASPVLSYLAAMGVGTIGVVAGGTVNPQDLSSQPIYFSSQEGKSKIDSLAKQLREINPEVKVNAHEQGLNENNVLDVFTVYDVVVDTGARMEQSLLINDACVILGKPMVYGNLFHPKGYISVFNYKGGATLRCMLAHQDIGSVFSEAPAPGLAILGGITGTYLANEVVKIAGEIGDVARNKLLVINHLTGKLDSLPIEPVPSHLTISSLRAATATESTDNISSDPTGIRAISAELLALKIKYKETLQIVDVRLQADSSAGEWNFLRIPENQLLQRSSEIHQDIMVILVSEDGQSAKKLCGLLNQRYGFDNIYYLEGGYKQWVQENQGKRITYESF